MSRARPRVVLHVAMPGGYSTGLLSWGSWGTVAEPGAIWRTASDWLVKHPSDRVWCVVKS